MQISIFRFGCEEHKRRICEILDIITEQKTYNLVDKQPGNPAKLSYANKSGG